MNDARGIFGPWLVPTDSLQCNFCKKVVLFSDLIAVEGKRFEKPDGGYWQTIFYHCSCDLQHPLAYDEGNGVAQLVGASAKL